MTEFSCIILAAGLGTRFGQKKQFIKIDGKPIWEIVRDKAEQCSDDVITVGIDIEGGTTRKESVRKGLAKVLHPKVVILESARPFVTVEQIMRIGSTDKPSVTYHMNSFETVLYHKHYLDRHDCTLLQTPQAFDVAMLIKAHDAIENRDVTDDTYLMKMCYGIDPVLLDGGPNLHKITYKEDMEYLKCLL